MDIVLLSETHLLLTHKFKIANYHIHRTYRVTIARGGSAILVRSSIPTFNAQFPQTPSFEATAIKVLRTTGGCLKFITAYKKQSINLTIPDLQSVFFENGPAIFGGDLNVKNQLWHSNTATSCGIWLADYA